MIDVLLTILGFVLSVWMVIKIHGLYIVASNKMKSTINMADRTSAGLFGTIFGLLAKNPTDEHKEIAKEIAKETRDYDFSNYQMDADDDLIKLGLARKGVDPEYPDDGEVIIYWDSEYFTPS